MNIEPPPDEWKKRLRSPQDWGPVPGERRFRFLAKADPSTSGQSAEVQHTATLNPLCYEVPTERIPKNDAFWLEYVKEAGGFVCATFLSLSEFVSR